MNDMSIEQRVKRVFGDLFEMDSDEVKSTLEMNDMEEWDSLMHIQLILALENEFSIKFTTQQILNMKSIATIIETVQQKEKN